LAPIQTNNLAPSDSSVPKELINFIREGTDFIVAGHEEPDGDCIGSQLAITSLLQRLGKNATPCTVGPFKRNEVKPYADRFLPFPVKKEGMRVLVMDCTNRERMGDLPIDGLPTASIDHHASGNPWGDVFYLDPDAPSVTFMTEKIFRALDMEVLPEEAELLFLGLCTDTGFFRHLDAGNRSKELFETAARMCGKGASPKIAFNAIHGGKSLNSRLLLGTVLAKTRSYYGGRLLLTDETLEESKRYGVQSRDSDILYQLLQSIEGVEAMAFIRQETKEECTMGLRSRDRVNVAVIAESFGGGGHKNAAGAKVKGNTKDLEEKITAAFAPCFS
jgi:phosphoesterase RecJ-like protein